ncbi:MAG: alpha/beta hydrolase [Rivularia sp. ALOHA_DT_140]|nr:alpha/beta hydrolase [Rivularia sp. ALOHA_DT_140]
MILKNPDGTITHYEKFGDKPYLEQDSTSKTLLLLHGIGADHAMWEPQIQKYASLGYCVLLLDLFGHGLSSNLSNIDLSDWHNQINWLLEHNNVEKSTLIGVSMGGVIAQSFVVAHPEMVEAIIIADSFGELSTFQERMLGVSAVFGFYLFKILGKNMLSKGMHSTYKATYAREAQEYFEKVSLNIDFNQIILARKAINRINVLESLKSITIPALVIVGAEFGQFFIEINRKIADSLPNSEFIVLEQSMDPSNLVNPVEFDKQVLRFLKNELL